MRSDNLIVKRFDLVRYQHKLICKLVWLKFWQRRYILFAWLLAYNDQRTFSIFITPVYTKIIYIIMQNDTKCHW